MNDGDWICSDANCGNINFARRVSCYRCNKERPDTSKASKKKLGTEIGKTAAEKSRGLFNADDWQCNKCANVNWARRQTCNVCNAPKYGEVEARTGYGGGYNERGVVEYRRREPSSDDEYDEFGRKKRKRKPESQDRERPEKVGITEGAVFKNLPPTVLQKESYKEHNMPGFGPNLLMNTSHNNVKRKGSLSESSTCEFPSLTKAAVSRYQQINHPRQDFMLPAYKANGTQSRKRIYRDGDQTGSPIYDVHSKKSKQDITISPLQKLCDPVMENRVSSTKTEMVHKLSRTNPAEDVPLIYNIEEKTRCAAFAIVYNNCKIAASKFYSKFMKKPPDFETIFAWRQKLLTTGCLQDEHLEKQQPSEEKPSANTESTEKQETKRVCKMPNPDEIIISSDSEEESSKSLEKSRRSISAETVFIPGNTDLNTAGSAASTVDGRGSRARSCSQSTHQQSRSNSRDSQDSNYPDTDSEKGSKAEETRNVFKTTNVSIKLSLHGSDSESVSYNSGEDNFLSRVYGEGRKKRKVKKHTKLDESASNDVNTFGGYSTLKKTEQSPLVTGNIYTPNLRNMNTRTRENVEVDAYSSEYIPTKIGSTAKQNYQDFKDNVRKKGYWAKGNGSSLTINKHNMSMNVIHQTKGIPNQIVADPIETVGTAQYAVHAEPMKCQADDFTRLDINNLTNSINYLPFEPKNSSINEASENTDRIFAAVQSNNASKNRSILDIFDISDSGQKSPEKNNDLDQYEDIRRMYENEWDEDDEALYQKTDCDEQPGAPRPEPSPAISNRTQSPTSDMLYTTEKHSQQTCTNKSLPDFIKNKHDLLLDMLKDFQNKEISQMVSPLKHGMLQSQSTEDNNAYQKSILEKDPYIAMTGFEAILDHHANRPHPTPNLLTTRPDPQLELTHCNPSVVRSDRSTKLAIDGFDSSPNHTVTRTDTPPKHATERRPRVSNKTTNRSDLILNHNKDKPDPISDHVMPGDSPIPKQSKTSPERVSNRTMKRSDLTPNLVASDSIPNLSRPNQGLNHIISRSDLTQNLNPNRPETTSNVSMISAELFSNNAMSDLNRNLIMNIPDPIPIELSNEVLRLSEGNVDCEKTQNASKTASPKRVRIIENIPVHLVTPHQNIAPSYQQNTTQHTSPKASQTNNSKLISSSPKVDAHSNIKFVSSSPILNLQTNIANTDSSSHSSSHSSSPKLGEKQDMPEKPKEKEQPVPQVDLSNLLSGINTNTLLLALQSLQQIAKNSSPKQNEQITTEQQQNEQITTEQQSTEEQEPDETINLTNDEEWEKESNREGSIERQLKEMDGNTGDTPFLSDIFDPGPVVIPPNIVRKLNLNMPNLEGDGAADTNSSENAPVIGNFKSFALPKPILLNRLKVTVKSAEKPAKSSSKKVKRKNKSKPSAAPAPGQPEAEEEDDEESGDEADLSKYDLWGSDAEQGNSSKAENEEKSKDEESTREAGSGSPKVKNDKVSPNNKSKRSRSSSTSSSSSSSSSSSHSSTAPQNKFDDFNLNSERETSPKSKHDGRKTRTRSRSRSPRSRASSTRRKSRDSRSAGETRSHESSRDRDRRDRPRGKERRYSRDGGNHYNSRGRHR